MLLNFVILSPGSTSKSLLAVVAGGASTSYPFFGSQAPLSNLPGFAQWFLSRCNSQQKRRSETETSKLDRSMDNTHYIYLSSVYMCIYFKCRSSIQHSQYLYGVSRSEVTKLGDQSMAEIDPINLPISKGAISLRRNLMLSDDPDQEIGG